MNSEATILCAATKGPGTNEEDRIRSLLSDHAPLVFELDRKSKIRSAYRLLTAIARRRPDLVVLEGTGIATGLSLMIARGLFGSPYVVSSGDAITPFLSLERPWLRPLAAVYERMLYRRSAGFIGWTPYLAGRALTYGAPRVMTAPGFAPYPAAPGAGSEIRVSLGIPPNAIVFGIVGALNWTSRREYCYGLELVRAARDVERTDFAVVIVGDGSGLTRLRHLAAEARVPVIFTGAVPQSKVPGYLDAFDVASLPQSVDGIGAFRYTTKLSEYLAARVPVATGQIPLAYDLDEGWLWRLPGEAPWDSAYTDALTDLMSTVTRRQIEDRVAAIPARSDVFSEVEQRARVSAFVADLLAART